MFLITGFVRLRHLETRLHSVVEIERCWFNCTATLATGRPGRKPVPIVRAGLKRSHRSDVHLGRVILQVVIKKWAQDFPTKIQRGIAAKFDSAQRTAFPDLLTVMPRSHYQKYFVVVCVLRFDLFVDGLLAPEGVIARMLEQLAPKAHLL